MKYYEYSKNNEVLTIIENGVRTTHKVDPFEAIRKKKKLRSRGDFILGINK